MSKPNLFSFATSELSQDAFICWLVSWANNPEEKELSGCAKDFICMLYNLNKSSKISSEAVTEVKNIRKQYEKRYEQLIKERKNENTATNEDIE